MLSYNSIHNFYASYDKSKFHNLNGNSLNQALNKLNNTDLDRAF